MNASVRAGAGAEARQPTPLVILGAGGHGRETLLLVQACIAAGAPFAIRGFLDDDPRTHGSARHGVPVLGPTELLAAWSASSNSDVPAAVLGIGSPTLKHALVTRWRSHASSWPTFVHPDVVLHASVRSGVGVTLHAGTIATCDIILGDFVTVNRRVDLSHDVVVDEFATLAPAVTLTGAMHIGVGADVGARATGIPGSRVGAWSRLGAGATVVRDIPPHVTAAGVPARVLRVHSSSELAA